MDSREAERLAKLDPQDESAKRRRLLEIMRDSRDKTLMLTLAIHGAASALTFWRGIANAAPGKADEIAVFERPLSDYLDELVKLLPEGVEPTHHGIAQLVVGLGLGLSQQDIDVRKERAADGH